MSREASTDERRMVTLENVMVPMRDGVRLATDISVPSSDGVQAAPGRYPALIMRTPYSKEMAASFPPDMIAVATVVSRELATSRGYVVVFQDVRGSGASEGLLKPMLSETDDAVDTLAWIAQQPWSDGRVAFFGPSYSGGATMMGTVGTPKELVTSFVQVPATDQFKSGWVYFDGVYMQHLATQWALMQSLDPASNGTEEEAAAAQADFSELLPGSGKMTWMTVKFPDGFIDELVRRTPLKDMPVVRHVSFWRDMIDNRDNPAFFAPNAMADKLARVNVPAIHVGGWYDGFIRNTYEQFQALAAGAATREAREGQRLFIGPWSHGGCPESPPGAAVDGQALMLAWMDQCFKGIRHPVFEAPVTIYVMGENRWRTETSWPLPGTQRTRFFIHSSGSANTASGDGTLTLESPSQGEQCDHYLYDPADPVPVLGGISMYGGRLAQNEMEARPDVLCYTSEALSEDLEVTGTVSAKLFAASSAQDTDWWVRLIDVRP